MNNVENAITELCAAALREGVTINTLTVNAKVLEELQKSPFFKDGCFRSPYGKVEIKSE